MGVVRRSSGDVRRKVGNARFVEVKDDGIT